MGMFDYVHLTCPHCGKRVETQSKSGPCALADFYEANLPYAVGVDMAGEQIHCEHCHESLTIEVVTKPTFQVVAWGTTKQTWAIPAPTPDHEKSVLKKAVRMLLTRVNAVTAPHRHGQEIPNRRLDDLANRQIDVEKLIAENLINIYDKYE